MIDETNNRYGLLVVKEKAKDKNGRSAWLCECDCGNTTIVRGPDLRKGKRTSCGPSCPAKINGNFKDLTGQKFNRLTVLYFKEMNKFHKSVWHCKCDCGNECDIIGTTLIRGTTTSCGCYNREITQKRMMTDLIGKRFGKLTVLDYFLDENKHVKWKCQCDCGNIVNFSGQALTNQDKGPKSCGCIKSQYEMLIENFLFQNKISYKKEQSFDQLTSDKGRKLRYDFGILKNNKIIGLIEFQGDQHFENVEFFGGQEEYQKRIYHDNLKKDFAQKNNIPLLYLTKNNLLENKILDFLNRINYYKEKEDL